MVILSNNRCASIIMARWVADEGDGGAARYLTGNKVIELGAGVGVSGLSGCLHAKPRLFSCQLLKLLNTCYELHSYCLILPYPV
jgi:hypothetical protein